MIDTQEESRLGNSLVVVIALALALRLPMLDVGIWFDEIRLITEFGPLPFSQLITTYGSDTNHPLYTILAWLSLQAFGEHTWALRLPSLAFGLLSLVAIARLSARILGARKAVLIAFLAAISYHHVWFSNNARGYTALLFFTVAATYELLCLLDDRGRGRMLTYALYLALATWVHTTAVFVALAHLIVIVFLAGRSRSRGMLGLALAALVSLLLHAPILGEMLAFLFGGEGHLPVASEWTNPLWTLREALRSFGIAPELAAAAGLLAASFLLLGVNRLRHLDRRLPWLFFLPAVFVTVAMVVLERNIWPRFYFNLYGFFLILAVVSLDACADWATRLLPRFRHAFAVGVGIMVLASALILPPALTVPKQDFRAAARFLDEKHEEGAAIVTLGLATKPFAAYYRKPYAAIDTLQQLNEIIAREGDVYAVDTLSTFLRSRMPEIAAAIQSGGTTVATFPGSVGGGEITVYRLSKNRVTQDER